MNKSPQPRVEALIAPVRMPELRRGVALRSLEMTSTDIQQHHDFWFALFQKAFHKSPFDALCTLLRPRGMHDVGWDILDESQTTFDDFNWMLTEAHQQRGENSARRFALHYYCFVIEMTAIHETIMNTIRCISAQRYLPFPLAHLNRSKGKRAKDPWDVVPASMPTKLREIRSLASTLGETELVKHLDYVFDESVRNAIAHSAYILFEDEFRVFGTWPPRVMKFDALDRLIAFSFAFLSGLLKAHANMRFALGNAKRFHKWENYEVLELISNESGVYGFHVHFSNGSRSTFTREKNGVTMINMTLRDGVGFMPGVINGLEPVWKVNGVPVADWDALNR